MVTPPRLAALAARLTAVAALALALGWTTLPAFAATPEHLRYYSSALSAADEGRWQQVEELMRRAIERKPNERRRRLIRRTGYYPHYYFGLARYQQGDCAGALAAWAESEDQGAIVGTEEFDDLLRFRKDCRDDGEPSLAARGPAPSEPVEEAAAGSGDDDRPTGKEKVRGAQHLIERGAEPAGKTFGALEGAAPEGSRLSEAASRGKRAVDVAETATDIVDLALSPSQRLEAAIDAYFAGKPAETLRQLRDIDLSDPRASAQVHLFRAAASFRLHLLAGGDPSRLAAARESAARFRTERWRTDFPAELFDPRFVRFLRGGG